MEVRIREFRKEDMDALYFLNQRCYPPGHRLPYARLLDMLLDRDAAALVAEELGEHQSRLIGALIVQGDPWNATLYIISLMVDGQWRRVGIARRLLGWAERLGEGFNCSTLLVPLESGNPEGKAFLNAGGFVESEAHDPFFAKREDGNIWRKSLEVPGAKKEGAKKEGAEQETGGGKTDQATPGIGQADQAPPGIGQADPRDGPAPVADANPKEGPPGTAETPAGPPPGSDAGPDEGQAAPGDGQPREEPRTLPGDDPEETAR